MEDREFTVLNIFEVLGVYALYCVGLLTLVEHFEYDVKGHFGWFILEAVVFMIILECLKYVYWKVKRVEI